MDDKYTYRVTWSPEDGEYLGLCAEFPSLSWLAGSYDAALKGIREVVKESIEDMKASGEEIPEPIATRNYSGKFTVRVTPEMHKNLSLQAAESKVSFNRFINSKLVC